MKNFSTNTFLLLLCSMFTGLQAQVECYDSRFDMAGLVVNRDSLNHFACEVGKTLPDEVSGSFKVISVNEYSLDISKNTVDLNRYKTNFLDSLDQNEPYHLVFWWRPESGRKIGGVDIFFAYPGDEEFGNCFSSAKITLIERRLEEEIRATAFASGNILES